MPTHLIPDVLHLSKVVHLSFLYSLNIEFIFKVSLNVYSLTYLKWTIN